MRGGFTDVDEPEPRPLRPQPIAISERSDRRRMGIGGTADPAGQAWRRQTHDNHAGGGERPDVHSLDRLSVAREPEEPAAERLGLRLLRSVDISRHVGTSSPRALSTVSRTRAEGSQSDRRHHRQPKREKRRKRGACIDPHGYDAGKKIKGKKRHILVDTLGLLLHAIVHPADIQDRDGGVLVMATLFGMFPFLKPLFADSGYQGPKFAKGLAKVLPHIDIEIVKRSDQVNGFVVLPKRWIVERTIAWLNRCRRLAKDWENLNRKALAFLRLASIRLMLRKLCNPA